MEVRVSRLDSFIRRLQAQRACLDHACALIRDLQGPALELGLGNGRTYDHLRERLPGRPILVFERRLAAHPVSAPDPADLILGDLEATLPQARARLPAPAALAHSDIGTGVAVRDRALARVIARHLPDLLAPGAVVVSDQRLDDRRLVPLDLPREVAPGRYFIYRRSVGDGRV
jgi:hypothetical protein